MNTSLPKNIRVGPYTYQVIVEDKPFVDDTGQSVLSGQHNPHDGVIRVLRGSPDRMFVTLWHELLHAADDIAETGLFEETVARLAPVVAGILLDNGYVTREEGS